MPTKLDRAASIFGNDISAKDYKKACKAKERFAHKYGEDEAGSCHLQGSDVPVISEALGVRNLEAAQSEGFDIYDDAMNAPVAPETDMTVDGADGKPVIVGNIRMGFGHYRISMAMASAAHAMGYTPYWLDLMAFPDTTCTKVIAEQNKLYSMGSRLSQKVGLFNKVVWEPLNSEGFRKLSYNASDQKVTELMTAPFEDLPKEIPFIGTHAWPAQAANHAGMQHVVNAIPDNWPMALHLAEGAIHAVQTPKCLEGYGSLDGMDKKRELKPMPEGAVVNTGHYVDHEIVANIEADCARRLRRIKDGKPVRYLLSVGGAGAQQKLFKTIIEHLVPYIEAGEATLMINVGDHGKVWNDLAYAIPALQDCNYYFDDFDAVKRFADDALDGDMYGIHAFCDRDIFSAVYSTNLLMRCCDVLITKPSELSFYPVPKLMIKRVGGHEAWGAIRAAELGDGTYEMETESEITGMIDSFQETPELIEQMCFNIECEKKRGTYNGAYEVVRLATEW